MTPRRNRVRNGVWPERSDPLLGKLFEKYVLPRFHELKRDEFRVIFGTTKKGTLAQVVTWRYRKGHRVIRRYHLITVNTSQSGWEHTELVALLAHELGHIVNDLTGIRPQTWEEQELAATSQAVARGFIIGFQQIFQRLCKTPCWEVMNPAPNGSRIIRGRSLGGLYCNCLGGDGIFKAYCPFADDFVGFMLSKPTLMQRVKNKQGVCVLCKRALKKKHPAFQCSSCGMLYHIDCLKSYLKRAHLVCPSCRLALTDIPAANDTAR
jgi:hypothetical protein